MSTQDVKATRMELLNLKKRISLAKKGHKLLKEKRDALFNEFFNSINEAKEVRKNVEGQLSDAYHALKISEVQLGRNKISQFASEASNSQDPTIEMTKRNIMGVEVPKLTMNEIKKKVDERGYSIVDSSASVDDCAKAFENSLTDLVRLAEKESTLMNLAFEIEKTKRKVNVLEYVLLPRLESMKKYISFRLEERERDQFFALKKIKKKLDIKEELKKQTS